MIQPSFDFQDRSLVRMLENLKKLKSISIELSGFTRIGNVPSRHGNDKTGKICSLEVDGEDSILIYEMPMILETD